MVFHSIHYLVFLSVSVLVYYATPFRARWIPLLAASCAFYMSWRFEFIFVLLSIAAIQYGSPFAWGNRRRQAARRPYLFASLAVGLGLLVLLQVRRRRFGLACWGCWGPQTARRRLAPVALLVPIGISFYTLQTIGYLIDVYHGRRQPERHFGIFAVFVSFFPDRRVGADRASRPSAPAAPEGRSASSLPLREHLPGRQAHYLGLLPETGDRRPRSPLRRRGIRPSRQAFRLTFLARDDLLQLSDLLRLRRAIPPSRSDRPGSSASTSCRTSTGPIWRSRSRSSGADGTYPLGLASGLCLPAPGLCAFPPDAKENDTGSLRVDKIIYVAAIFTTFSLCGLWHGPNATFLAWGCLHGLYLALENSFRIRSRHGAVNIGRTYRSRADLLGLLPGRDRLQRAWHILRKIVTAPGACSSRPGPDVVAPLYAIGGIGLLVVIEMKREFYRGTWTFFGHRERIRPGPGLWPPRGADRLDGRLRRRPVHLRAVLVEAHERERPALPQETRDGRRLPLPPRCCRSGDSAGSLSFSNAPGSSIGSTRRWRRETRRSSSSGVPMPRRITCPRCWRQELGLSCYNAGVLGQQILFHKTLESIVLERTTPDVIILDVDPSTLYESSETYDRLAELKPFYFRYPDDHRSGPRPPIAAREALSAVEALSVQLDDRARRPLRGLSSS